MPKSVVWTHFVRNKKTSGSKCKYCQNTLYSGNSTGGLWYHLKSKHPGVLEPIASAVEVILEEDEDTITREDIQASGGTFTTDAATAQDDEKDVPGPSTSRASGPSTTSRRAETTLRKRKQGPMDVYLQDTRPCTPGRSEFLDDQITQMIVLDLLPISTVQNTGFRQLMGHVEPNYTVLSRQSATRRVEVLYEKEAQKLKAQLQKADCVAITTDSWTSKATESYITVTGHYFQPGYELKSAVLVTVDIEERHTAPNLRENILKVTEEWGITTKVSAIVHDNASNIVAAAKELPFSSVPCFAHTLQLSIQAGLSLPEVADILSASSRLVTHFRHSSVATRELRKRQELFSLPQHKLIQLVKTRWNSAHGMISRLIEQKRAIVDVLEDRELTSLGEHTRLQITPEQWELMGQLQKCLEPLNVATTVLCGQDYVTLSSVLPIAHSMVTHHLKEDPDDSYIIQCLKDTIASDLGRRMKLDKPKELRTAVQTLASLLDPRYKRLLFLPESERSYAQEKVKKLFEEETSERRAADTEEEAEPQQDLRCAVDILLGPEYSTVESAAEFQELTYYMSDPQIRPSEDPLKWWKRNQHRFPVLSKIARRFLVVPATSVPSERVFSTAGATITSVRNRLTPEHADMLIFLHENMNRLKL